MGVCIVPSSTFALCALCCTTTSVSYVCIGRVYVCNVVSDQTENTPVQSGNSHRLCWVYVQCLAPRDRWLQISGIFDNKKKCKMFSNFYRPTQTLRVVFLLTSAICFDVWKIFMSKTWKFLCQQFILLLKAVAFGQHFHYNRKSYSKYAWFYMNSLWYHHFV